MGEVALITKNDKYYLAPNVARIRANKCKLKAKFLLHIFNVPSFKDNEIAKYISSSSQAALTMGNVRKFIIAIPTLPEQQKIADCLSSIDDRITAETQKLDTLKAHKKGLMQQLFPAEGETLPKLRFPEFQDSGEWEEKKLEELLEFKNGINASKEQYGKGTKFINVLDILQNEFITYEKIIGSVDVSDEIVNKFSVNYGDILFQRSSETQEEVGTASVYLDRERTATFGGFVIRGKKIGEYEPIFLNKLLKSQPIRNSISSKSGGSTRFNIGQENLSATKIFLPSLPEQQKIADCLSSIDEAIAAQSQAIDLLKLHKKGLMQQLFPSVEEVKG
ncbi:MAG: restriction endonuclease subunit S [Cyanobacteria bacterium]|nr:restriction endonuclease subunit S [Cyanobacteriota bacterium]